MSNSLFSHYTTDYISGVMSLRKPQKKSLEILANILDNINIRKQGSLDDSLSMVNQLYPICTAFEREFISLTFALATGVGKTRLMGAFMTYLYTRYDIKNFFVVAPGKTIYEKLQNDLGNPSSEKYVFKGLDCFDDVPKIVTGDDYERSGQTSLFDNGIKIYIFNIDKFNKENAKLKATNEHLGKSFIDMITEIKDLVLIMDESHHYRADAGWEALNELKPIIGLELTATPMFKKKGKSKQVKFKNVVYEYTLAESIADGYTRTPYAITRSNIIDYDFGTEEMDKLMLNDGATAHEDIKRKLEAYANNNNVENVKPFMLVVCKDTEHAEWVEKYVKSMDFRDGYYLNKTITVHSNKRGSETEANMKLLLDVERTDNPIEIVIHVNMLKEGWDVNNLYTIVPLRTAASKILREQMVGRGLRLPYGKRTGEEEIDGVYLTAHDKFDEILEEAQKGDSIFKADKVIKIEDIENKKTTYVQKEIPIDEDEIVDNLAKTISKRFTPDEENEIIKIHKKIKKAAYDEIKSGKESVDVVEKIIEESKETTESKDWAQKVEDNRPEVVKYFEKQKKEIKHKYKEKYIPIPQIIITDEGVEEYNFEDFDLDISKFSQVPIENELLIQSLTNQGLTIQIDNAGNIDFDSVNPKKEIVDLLRNKPEIDYEKCKDLLVKIISQLFKHYDKYNDNEIKNIVMMHRREIANELYNQMMQHFYITNGLIKEEVVSVSDSNIDPIYNSSETVGLFDDFSENIHSVLFTDIEYGVFREAKFDSKPELIFAQICEREARTGLVKNWLRPAPKEFNIKYNGGKHYEPDFVVETDDVIYLVEVKGEDKLDDPDVISKKKRAIQYCEAVSRWAKANGYKEWSHLFIPSKQIQKASTFKYLAQQFIVNQKSGE